MPLAAEREAQGIKVYRLNMGDPDIAPADVFFDRIKSYPSKMLKYAPSSGNVDHVIAWQKYYAHFGVQIDKKNIIPTLGCAEAILFSLMAVADSGDEIIVFEPLYACYKGMAVELGIKLVPITLRLQDNFRIPSNEEIIKKINEKTKAIVLIQPNNPNGSIISLADQKRLAELAIEKDLYIISDETYREIVFKGEPTCMLSLENAKENIIVLDSASKRFSCPGARIGCIASHNTELMKAILRLAMLRLSAPTLEQYALIPFLENSEIYTKDLVVEYRKRRDAAVEVLQTISGVHVSCPDGAFYMMASLPVKDSNDFVKFLITEFSDEKETVLVTPAADFYITPGFGANEIRIAFVLNVDDTKRALQILKKGLESYLNR